MPDDRAPLTQADLAVLGVADVEEEEQFYELLSDLEALNQPNVWTLHTQEQSFATLAQWSAAEDDTPIAADDYGVKPIFGHEVRGVHRATGQVHVGFLDICLCRHPQSQLFALVAVGLFDNAWSLEEKRYETESVQACFQEVCDNLERNALETYRRPVGGWFAPLEGDVVHTSYVNYLSSTNSA
jgi:hypothetical protein